MIKQDSTLDTATYPCYILISPIYIYNKWVGLKTNCQSCLEL